MNDLSRFPPPPVGMNEAAALLGVSRRTLTDALKALPFYELRGRVKVFYPEHIDALRKGMHRCACQSDGSRDGPMFTASAPMESGSDALSKLVILSARRKRERH